MPFINELQQSMDDLIRTKKENCDKGGITAAGISDYVRRSTHDLINLAQAKKDDVVSRLKKKFAKETVKPFQEIEATEAEINQKTADIRDYYTASTSYAEKAVNTNYTLFYNYYDGYQKKKGKNKQKEDEDQQEDNFPHYINIKQTAQQQSQVILNKIKKGFIKSFWITVACITLDAFMIYSPFVAGNVGSEVYTAIFSAIFALIIDSLPTGMGIISAEILNIEKMIDLKKISKLETASDKKKVRRWKIAFFSMFVITILFFILYLAGRFAMFLGGGDFDKGMHIFLDNGNIVENLKEIEFQFADISGFVPAGSSVLAYFLSKMFIVTESMCVDQFNIRMRDALDDARTKCNNERLNLLAQKNALIENKNNQMTRLWAIYGDINQPVPENLADFIIEVQSTAQIQAITAYSGAYQNFCSQARRYTEIKINTLKETLSPYSNKPADILKMPVLDAEKEGLNYIWNIDGKQHTQTEGHIKDLEDYIENMLSRWERIETAENTDENNKSDDYEDDLRFNTENTPSERKQKDKKTGNSKKNNKSDDYEDDFYTNTKNIMSDLEQTDVKAGILTKISKPDDDEDGFNFSTTDIKPQ